MKTKLTYFLTGVVTAILIAALSVSALALDGWTVKVYPIEVLVDGQVFEPKDVNGDSVMVFTLNGTTYCPVRALAEAYGLEVGYDPERNLATVDHPWNVIREPDPTAKDFGYQWRITEKPVTNNGTEKVFTAKYAGPLNQEDFKTWWKSFSESELKHYAEQLAADARDVNPGCTVTMYFTYGSNSLGTAYAIEGHTSSDFRLASLWIK